MGICEWGIVRWARARLGRAGGGYAVRTWQNELFRYSLWWFTQLNKMPALPHAALLAMFILSDGMSTCAWMSIAGAAANMFETSETIGEAWGDSVMRTLTLNLDLGDHHIHFGSVQGLVVILLNIPVKLCGVRSSHVLRCVAMTLVLLQASMFGIQILLAGTDALEEQVATMEGTTARPNETGTSYVGSKSTYDYALIPITIVMVVLFMGSWRLAIKIYTLSLAALLKRKAVPRELEPEAMQRFHTNRGIFRYSLLKRYTVLSTLPRLYWTPAVLVSPIITMCVASTMMAFMAVAYYVAQDNPNPKLKTALKPAIYAGGIVLPPWFFCAMLTARPSHCTRKLGACILTALTALSVVINVAVMIWRGVRFGHSAKLLLSDVFTYHLMCTMITLTCVPAVLAGLRQAYKDAGEGLKLTLPPLTWVEQRDAATDTAADGDEHPPMDVTVSEGSSAQARSSTEGPHKTDETRPAPTASDDDDASTQSDTKLV